MQRTSVVLLALFLEKEGWQIALSNVDDASVCRSDSLLPQNDDDAAAAASGSNNRYRSNYSGAAESVTIRYRHNQFM